MFIEIAIKFNVFEEVCVVKLTNKNNNNNFCSFLFVHEVHEGQKKLNLNNRKNCSESINILLERNIYEYQMKHLFNMQSNHQNTHSWSHIFLLLKHVKNLIEKLRKKMMKTQLK